MKQKTSLARATRHLLIFGLILIAGCLTARAQVTPHVRMEAKNGHTGTARLTQDAAFRAESITVDSPIPLNSVLTINRGGANQEGGNFYVTRGSGTGLYVVSLGVTNEIYILAFAHTAGEIVEFSLARRCSPSATPIRAIKRGLSRQEF